MVITREYGRIAEQDTGGPFIRRIVSSTPIGQLTNARSSPRGITPLLSRTEQETDVNELLERRFGSRVYARPCLKVSRGGPRTADGRRRSASEKFRKDRGNDSKMQTSGPTKVKSGNFAESTYRKNKKLEEESSGSMGPASTV